MSVSGLSQSQHLDRPIVLGLVQNLELIFGLDLEDEPDSRGQKYRHQHTKRLDQA